MKFKLEIDCDNAAFEDNAETEIARILFDVGEFIRCESGWTRKLRDVNGNTVGRAWVEQE